jgi:ABC-type nitrate/sulfonate/bicarbonate transport system substrate-binding protein
MKIAVSAAQSQFYVELLLERAGLAAQDVEFTTLSTADMVAALTGKAIDAAWEVEPLIGAIRAQGLGTLTGTGFEGLPGGVPWIIFESPNFAATGLANRTLLMRAYLRGLRDFYHAFNLGDASTEPVIESLAAHSAVHDPALLRTIGMHTVDPNAALDLSVLDRYQDYYLQAGDQAQRVDLTSFFDAEPLNTALAELGRL